MKTCRRCAREKLETEFFVLRREPDGLNPWCKTCVKANVKKYRRKHKRRIQAKDRARNKTRYDKDRKRAYYLKHRFGISSEQYEALLEQQNHCCAICERHESEFKTKLAVDHRHAGPRKGEITGLLCTFCNHKFIGRNWNPDHFERAAAYLRQGTGWFVPEKNRKAKR